MKESYSEGLANHTDPESCEGVPLSFGSGYSVEYREDALEALTGETAGQAIEPRNQVVPEADPLMLRGKQYRMGRLGEAHSALCAVEEPGHVAKLFTRKPGDLGIGLTDVASGQVRVLNPKGATIR